LTEESATGGHAGISILIVDDDAGAIEAFTQMLETEGYTVRVATDAPAAFAELERAVPSAVILDLHLPVTDGLEVLRRLRTMTRLANLPVAIVTGNYLLDEQVARELRGLGAKLYFKPIWDEDLTRIVHELIGP
jgi:CheY-like chemotaxis protein